MRRRVVDGGEGHGTVQDTESHVRQVAKKQSSCSRFTSHHSRCTSIYVCMILHAQRGVLTKDLTCGRFMAHDPIRPVSHAAWTISFCISIPSLGLTLTAEQSFRSSTPWPLRWAGQGGYRVLNPAGSSAVAGCYIRTHCFVSCINTSVKGE